MLSTQVDLISGGPWTHELPEPARAYGGLAEGWVVAPPPLLTPSQWADEHRRLPETSAARGARWRTSFTPYLRGIMDSVTEPGVRKIALIKGAQTGGSEALHNILGFFIHHDPCAMLMVHPSKEVAQEWSKERLDDMLRSAPALNAIVTERTDQAMGRRAESTLTLKLFPNGYLALGGANTPNTFARRSVRIAMGDDVDRFPAVVGDEGDPAELLENRTTTFWNGLTFLVSTPTLVGGRIDTLYKRSDQRRFFVTCPNCGRSDWIAWSDRSHFWVYYEADKPDTARLACSTDEHGGCGTLMGEPERRRMVTAGEWRPTAVAREPGLIGFHLPAMLSLLGAVSLPWLVGKWIAAQDRGPESLKVFINTMLGEGWEQRGRRVEHQKLYDRREQYGADVEVPAGAVVLTAGVDVQENRFEIQVHAWGLGEERWLVDWRSIPGTPDSEDAETWSSLLAALKRRYRHASGLQLPIHATCIDSGYATERVYDFVLAQQARKVFATKGFAGKSGNPIVMKVAEKTYGKRGRPVRLHPINVDDAKTKVMNDLQIVKPGPGYFHFPLELETCDEEYFAQLCSEHKEPRKNRVGTITHEVWVQDRDRNEGLDTAVLCLAAFRIFRPNIRELLAQVDELAAQMKNPPAPGAAAADEHGGRRVSVSDYLRGGG